MGPENKAVEFRGSEEVWTVTLPPAVTTPRLRLYMVTVVGLNIFPDGFMMIELLPAKITLVAKILETAAAAELAEEKKLAG